MDLSCRLPLGICHRIELRELAEWQWWWRLSAKVHRIFKPWALWVWHGVWTEGPVDGAQQRVSLTTTPIPEVIQIQRPDHATTKTHLLDPLRLRVSQESSCSGVASCLATSIRWLVESILGGVPEGEGLAVHWHAHHQLVSVGALLNPVVNGEVLGKERGKCLKRMRRLTVVKVCPSVMRLDEEIVVVEHCKAIHNVGAQIHINVLRQVLALTLSVPRPVVHNINEAKPCNFPSCSSEYYQAFIKPSQGTCKKLYWSSPGGGGCSLVPGGQILGRTPATSGRKWSGWMGG
ncbi:hypothetical protein E2C01_001070 [Portunus trituberculatus]|uniref:Uncharacterized protein n=1 Tax=Portunus trituberculatus TaxID=210409 RepID=A0A5B7CLK3_PORTR|nr:hypothetical protein [Portunus trituberculatus]